MRVDWCLWQRLEEQVAWCIDKSGKEGDSVPHHLVVDLMDRTKLVRTMSIDAASDSFFVDVQQILKLR